MDRDRTHGGRSRRAFVSSVMLSVKIVAASTIVCGEERAARQGLVGERSENTVSAKYGNLNVHSGGDCR